MGASNDSSPPSWDGEHEPVPRSVMPHHLLNLALSCQTMHKIVEPVLYRRYGDWSFRDDRISRLRSFLCAILSRPHLRGRVRYFECCETSVRAVDAGGPLLNQVEYSQVEEAIRRVGLEDGDNTWAKAIADGQWEATFALVLCQLRDLRSLELDECHMNYDDNRFPYMAKILKERSPSDFLSREFPLPVPCHVSISAGEDDWGMGFSKLLQFLRVKNVRSFSARGIGIRAWDENESSNLADHIELPVSFGTKHLELRKSRMDPVALTQFLRCFPDLELLCYDHRLDRWTAFHPETVIGAISCLQPVLRSLTLVASIYWGDENGDPESHAEDGVQYFSGSLAEFRMLKDLTITASFLILREDDTTYRDELCMLLPTSLENLTLKACDRTAVAPLTSMVAAKTTRLKSLRSLDLGWEMTRFPDKPSPELPSVHPGFTDEEAIALLTDCTEAGISMVLTPKPPPEKRARHFTRNPQNGKKQLTVKIFKYPYENYDAWCKYRNLNPESGDPWDMPQPRRLNAGTVGTNPVTGVPWDTIERIPYHQDRDWDEESGKGPSHVLWVDDEVV